MEEILWKLFKETGDIKYFVLMNKIKNETKLKVLS